LTAPFVADEARLSVDRERLWAVFEDPAALARVLPGCERLESIAPGVYRGVLASKLQFLTLRADVDARILDVERPDRLRLEIDGRPKGLAGGFRASIPIELVPADGSGTLVRYSVALSTTGRLATFGAPILRDTFRRQVAQLVANLERELAVPG
jgi:carbon monoxide dehydrogenase subunit G